MFAIPQHTRRQIGLTVFFLSCIVPTAVVVGWSIAWRLPWHLHTETERLRQELGLDVTLQRLHHLRPGVVLYEGLELSDPETGRPMFRCARLEATWTKMTDSAGQQRPAIVLSTPRAEIESGAWDRLFQLLQQRLQGQGGRPEPEIRVTVDELALLDADSPQTLAGLDGGIGILPGGIQAQAAFRLAGVNSSEPIRIRVVRNRQLVPPANGFELNTADNEVPCRLLAIGLPDVRPLGPACRFSGYAWTNQASAGWEGELTGRLLGVDLGGLVSAHFPHRLQCMGDITLRRLQFRQGRLEEVAGTLTAGPGLIGRRLVDAAVKHLQLARPATPDATSDTLAFDRLGVEFAIDSHGLRLAGRCPLAEPGTLLASAQGKLLGEPALQPQPTAALIETLAPAGMVQLPASPPVDWLARHLPLPDSAAAATAITPSPSPRVELRVQERKEK